MRRGYQINIGSIGDKEVDFIASKFNEKIYIQVTETLLNENTRKRELAPLLAIKDNYQKIILTTDELFSNSDENGIKIINIIDWLLDN